MKKKYLYTLIIILVNWSFLFGNNESPTIEYFSYKDGLTTSTVYSVYKDFRGFIWVCTENGLFRYDGYNFRNLNSLINAQFNYSVFCVTEDNQHNLWIGTSGNGLFILENKTNNLIHLKQDFESSVNINQILFLKNKVWLATSIGVIVMNQKNSYANEEKLDFELLLPSTFSNQDKVINCFYYNGGNHLWVGTNAVLYEYNLSTGKFSPVYSDRQNSIRWLAACENRIIAASWDGGIFLIDTTTLKKTSSPFTDYANAIIGDQRVKTVFIGKDQKLYVATYGKGLFIFKSEKNKFSYVNFKNDKNIAENIKSNTINQMYLDDTGILWLCMNQPALTKIYYQEDNISFYSPNNKEKDISEITSVHQSIEKNKLWIATNSKGFYLFDTKNRNFSQFSSGTNSPIRLLNDNFSMCFQDSHGNIWIVYRRNGLYIIPANKANAFLKGDVKSISPIDANPLLSPDSRFNSYITKFYEDSKGRIWIGLWGSLFVVKINEKFKEAQNTENLIANSNLKCIYSDAVQTETKVPIFPVLSIQEIRKNEFWVGTLGGGVLTFKEKSEMHFAGSISEINKELPQLNVRCILRDKKNSIWIGTNGGLVYLNSLDGKMRIVKKADGLPSDDINNIVEGKNSNIWVSSYFGAAEFNTKDLSFQNYLSTKKEELNQYLINSGCIDSDGSVWFATSEAVVTIKSKSKSESDFNLPIYFTDIKIDNNTIKPLEKINGHKIITSNINECGKITVPYNHTLSIEFAELNYKNPGQVLYKYKIGKSKDWIILNSNQRNITFSSMKPGDYQLEVSSANSKNNENIKTLHISFLPPYWQSMPALLIYFIVILALFLTYRRITIQKVIQRNETEKERYERKKLEELDKLKSEFFSNISHEFRTPLSLIINPLEKLANEEEISSKNKEKIDLVLKSSHRLLKLTNELMDFSKIEKNSLIPYFQDTEIISYANNIFRSFENIAEVNKIDYRFNNSIEQLFVPIDRNMTEKVIFNLLSNAFKYTPKNGIILLDISLNNEFLIISVINSGEGIARENIEKVFDRYFQVNNVQNRKVEGTGIGLALVKNYVELQHGRVEVVSNPGTDTTFSIYLPLLQKEIIKDDASDSQIILLNEETKVSLKDKKLKSQYHILVVEDEDDLRNFIVGELQFDFKVTPAVNGEEGIKLANELIPDLIITDVMMPVLSGIDLCNTIKNQMSTSHIPIIILSAKTKVSEQIEGLEMGADVYMLKPFNMEHLKVQIIRLVDFKEKLYSRYLKENSLIPEGSFITKLDEEFINKIVSYLEANLSDANLGVDQMAKCVSLSKVQTYRKVKAITGLSVVEFIRTIRLKKAAQLILDRKLSFSEIAFETGFSSPSYFTRCFHEHFGKTPSEYAADYTR